MKHWIIGGALLVIIFLGFGAVFFAGSDVGPGGHEVVTRTVAADGTEMIIIREDGRHFFPFGLILFPLGVFCFLFLVRGLAFRGRIFGNGPWMPGTPHANEQPHWFDEWHKRAHAEPVVSTSPPPQAPEPEQSGIQP